MKPNIRQMKPDIRPDTRYLKRPDIRYNLFRDDHTTINVYTKDY